MNKLWSGRISFDVYYPENITEDNVFDDVNLSKEGYSLLIGCVNPLEAIQTIETIAKKRGGTVIWQIDSV